MDIESFLKEKGLYGEYLETNKVSLKSNEELIERFLTDNDFSKFTQEAYRNDLEYFIQTMNIENLQKVTSKDTYNFQIHLEKKQDLGIERKKRLLASVRSFFTFYQKISKIFDGEFHFIEFPMFLKTNFKEKDAKERSNKEITLTIEETKTFLEKVKLLNFNDYLMARLMIGSGMRIGDIINIEFENVDFDNQKIRTMTKKGVRVYYFNKETKQELLLYLRQREQIEPDIPNLFLDWQNQKIKNKSYTSQFKRLVRKVGCQKDISCHSLRRSFSTIRSSMGQIKDEISFLLGHTIRNVTDKYIKKTDQEKLAIFDKFDFLKRI